MIVQITITRNELFLLKEMLPIWKKYSDGFVFYVDESTDGTYEFLQENKEKYNILSILNINRKDELLLETDMRQLLFDEAFKFSKKIICLDTDEYLDGNASKEDLNYILDNNKDTIFHLNWIQYVNKNKIRIDGPWLNNYKDRIGSYKEKVNFIPAQSHSTHLPFTNNHVGINQKDLFIAHLQWIDKKTVATKQYFWKITDYVNNLKYNIDILGSLAYDASVNNFEWEITDFDFDLKINEDIYSELEEKNNYKLQFIKEQTQKYNIPNLGDWGMNIYGN